MPVLTEQDKFIAALKALNAHTVPPYALTLAASASAAATLPRERQTALSGKCRMPLSQDSWSDLHCLVKLFGSSQIHSNQLYQPKEEHSNRHKEH